MTISRRGWIYLWKGAARTYLSEQRAELVRTMGNVQIAGMERDLQDTINWRRNHPILSLFRSPPDFRSMDDSWYELDLMKICKENIKRRDMRHALIATEAKMIMRFGPLPDPKGEE